MADVSAGRKWFYSLIRLIGIDATRALMTTYGGKSIYVPKMSVFLQAKRDTLIYKQYCTGQFTVHTLADKWSLGTTSIHNIIKKMAQLDGADTTEGIAVLKNTIKTQGPEDRWKALLDDGE